MRVAVVEKLNFGDSVKIGYVSAILAAALFGSISTIAKPALVDVSPLLLSSAVYLLAGLTATPLKKKTRISEIKKRLALDLGNKHLWCTNSSASLF